MATKAVADQVPTNEAFHQLDNIVATKAVADQVPTYEEFHQLHDIVATKAVADQVPTNEAFHQIQNDVMHHFDWHDVDLNGSGLFDKGMLYRIWICGQAGMWSYST